MRRPLSDLPLPPCRCGATLVPAYYGQGEWALVCTRTHTTIAQGRNQSEARLSLLEKRAREPEKESAS